MNRSQKIALLKSWNIKIPAQCSNEKLDELISQNRKAKNEIQNKFGKISVSYDKAEDGPVEVMVYQDIGEDPWGMEAGFTAKDFLDAVKDVPNTRPLDLRINSCGGSVWEGMAIKTRMDEWKGRKTACIDGMAASVASWLPMSFDEIRAPRHAQMFIHPAWGMCMGNAEDMEKQAGELRKTTNQIADIYASRTGMTQDECLRMMQEETLMTGEEMLKYGFIDRLTDGEPVANFTEAQIRNMKSKLAILNKAQEGRQQTTQKVNMKRNQIEALLNKLGIKFNKSDTDEQLLKLLENYNSNNGMNRRQKVTWLNRNGVSTSKSASNDFLDKMILALSPSPKFKNEKDGEHSEDCNCAPCNMDDNPPQDGEGEEDDEPPANAPKPNAEPGGADAGSKSGDGALFKTAIENMKRFNKFMQNQRREAISKQVDQLVTDGRIPANSAPEWIGMAVKAEEDKDGKNPVLDQLSELPKNEVGRAPLNIIELGDSDSIADLDRNVQNLLRPQAYLSRNQRGPENLAERIMIGNNSKTVQRLINRMKKFDRATPKGMIAPLAEKDGGPQLVGPLREAWDSFASGSPRNANTMSTQLLRQVILSEVMRAFRRQFTSLEIFAHNFQSVPLEGTDYIEVPYYPLDTVASTEFKYADGYVVNPNAQTLYKQIYVGGIGNGVATPGSGRKYKPLQFSAYEIRRQPWLDIQKLSVLAGEQLAIDVRGDIMGSKINAANFGNAIWTGAANGFDHTVVGNTLLQAAIAAFWPLQGRNVVLSPSYYTNLAIDPGITPLLAIGTTDVLREGIVGGLYGFEQILHDPKLPIANFIQGGDGAVTAGTDPNLCGFMAWPSAILIATAPIMPPPGVLKKLVAYEQITDDQTGLAFTYQFWGNEAANVDNEIIECTYGSGLGQLEALFRLTSQGN